MPARKWILFDAGGVLEIVDDDAWQDQWWSRWCERTGLDRPDFDARDLRGALAEYARRRRRFGGR